MSDGWAFLINGYAFWICFFAIWSFFCQVCRIRKDLIFQPLHNTLLYRVLYRTPARIFLRKLRFAQGKYCSSMSHRQGIYLLRYIIVSIVGWLISYSYQNYATSWWFRCSDIFLPKDIGTFAACVCLKSPLPPTAYSSSAYFFTWYISRVLLHLFISTQYVSQS